jgi:DNA-binding CsgD family transcriptional regulator
LTGPAFSQAKGASFCEKVQQVMPIVFNKPVICPILIGRQVELAILNTLVEQAGKGQGQMVLLSGEAGIGKSRLAAEVKTQAHEQGFLLLQGNCFPTDRSSPYAPLLDLLGSSRTKELLSLSTINLEPLARELALLHPDLVPLSPGETQSRSLEPEQEKRRLFVALTHFFTSFAAKQPILLTIEDIHWSDETSLEFLHYLARHCASYPLLILATYRSDEVLPSLKHWLAQLDREQLTQEIALHSLTRGQIKAMLEVIFGQHKFAPDTVRFAHDEFLDTITSLTEGNPFFIEEMLKSLINSKQIFYSEGAWERKPLHELSIPRSIQDAVQRRATQLSEPARRLLTLAAIAGRRFDFTLLQQVMQCDEQQMLLLIKELITAQLVIEESEERFAFRHALTRQVIYTELLARERKMLHRTIAEAMEVLYPDDVDTHLVDFAYHCYEAGLWQRALEFAQRAGEKAIAFYAPRAALDYFTRALTAAAQLSLIPPSGLFRARGQAYELLGEFDRTRADYEAALQAARSTGESRAEWEALLHLGMLWTGRDYERSGEYYRHAFDLARTIGDASIIARSLNRLGNWHLNVEHPLEALAHHQEALNIFQELKDEPGIAETLDLLGMTSYLGGDLVRGTGYYEQAVVLFRRLDDRGGLTSSLATLTMRGITYQTDTMVPAVRHVSEVTSDGELALKIARETEQRPAEAYALIFLACCLGPQGDYTRALEYAEQGRHIAEEIDHRQWMAAAHCVPGALYRDLFVLPQARQHFERALHLANETCSLHWIRAATGHLASTYVLANDLLQAETILQAALPPTTVAQTLGQRLVLYARAELALARKEPSQALQITAQLMTSSTPIDESRVILRLARLRGEALIALNRISEAEEVLEHARKAAQQQAAPPLLWRLHLALGKCYQARRRYEAAEECFLAARDVIEQLAANVPEGSLRSAFLEQTRNLLSLLPPSPRRAAKRTYDGLTAREREIAVRIARGQSSREIAEALIISERTVETHVGNMFSKLGYSARTQIAAWAVEKGLVKKE